MQELVHGELIVVENPFGIREMLPNGIAVRAIGALGVSKMSVVLIEEEEVGQKLARGNKITATGAGFPIEDRASTVESRVMAMRLLIGKGRTDQFTCLAFLGLQDGAISRTNTWRQECQCQSD